MSISLLAMLPVVALVSTTSFGIAASIVMTSYGYYLRFLSRGRRHALLSSLGIATEERQRLTTVVGFFHPYCNAGGGGERVLWSAIDYMQRTNTIGCSTNFVYVVYTGDLSATVTQQGILDKVNARFGIELDPKSLVLLPLRSRYWIEDTTWKRFTLLGQSVGSMILAIEGIREGVIPDIWIDTMGYAFTYPLIQFWCKIPVGSYTHYPTISSDMLDRVAKRKAGVTNRGSIASSVVLTHLKLIYYRLFAFVYARCLRSADVVMVNSTWTKRHVDRLVSGCSGERQAAEDELKEIQSITVGGRRADLMPAATKGEESMRRRTQLSGQSNSPESKSASSSTSSKPLPSLIPPTPITNRHSTIVYPPCDTVAFSSLPIDRIGRTILSVAQFRPEKDHRSQLLALRLFFDQHPQYEASGDQKQSADEKVKLIMAGSVRGAEDEERVEKLREMVVELGLEKSVSFEINVPYPKLVQLFGQASVGLHTMIDEHFGITVVEMLAAGLIPLVHASAGPLLDIVVPYPFHASSSSAPSSATSLNPQPTGYHAVSVSTFAAQLGIIFSMTEEETRTMRVRARRNAVERFSVVEFEKGWEEAWKGLLCERARRKGPM